MVDAEGVAWLVRSRGEMWIQTTTIYGEVGESDLHLTLSLLRVELLLPKFVGMRDRFAGATSRKAHSSHTTTATHDLHKRVGGFAKC